MAINIAFVGKTAFPVSTASSNRILALAEGFTEAGANVDVYCFGLSRFPLTVSQRKGRLNNVNWHYFNKRIYAFKIRFLNGIYLFAGQLKGYPCLYLRYKNKRPVFITSNTSMGYILPLWIITKFCKGKLVFIRSEFPDHVLKKAFIKTFFIEKIVYPISFSRFDAMFLMTENLKQYFERWKREFAISELCPLTIDLEKFDKKSDSPLKFPYIAYCGSLSNEKDGIESLIRIFCRINPKFPDIHLIIIGGGKNQPQLELFTKLTSGDSGKVRFTGLLDHNKVPQYLANARVLALARPNSIQAEGGFPSKIGEYLATGRPVIVTDTGEITKYLVNNHNALLAEAGNEDDFVLKLEWLLNNPDEAERIGKNGKATAKKYFDRNIISQIMLNKLSRK